MSEEQKQMSVELREELKKVDPVTLLYHAMLKMGNAMSEMNATDINVNANATFHGQRYNVSCDVVLGEPKEDER